MDLRARRALREHALRQIKIAVVAAWVSASFSGAVFGVIAVSSDQWGLFWRAEASAAFNCALGWWMYRHQSPIAAQILGVLTAGNVVFRVLTMGSFVILIFGSLLCLAFYNAWRGTLTLRGIRQAEASENTSLSSPLTI